MKLSEHVETLRNLIEAAFDKSFARLGISKDKMLDIHNLPENLQLKRHRFEEMLENYTGKTGEYESAREKLMNELAFTLFNRLAAMKVMEAANFFPPVLTRQPEHGDRSFGHKAWLEIHPHMRSEELEGIREYLKYAFDEQGETLPLYSKKYPYALLPDAISLNDIIDAFNAVEQDAQVDDDIWQNENILGWLYESYNTREKKAHKASKAKTEYDKVSLQSQIYTPKWVVQFLVNNSLGKLYLEMYPGSKIKRRDKIANAPKTQMREPKPLHRIKMIDPACGSGNFLLYAFDFFYDLYLDQIENFGAEYKEADIPQLIISHNLNGIDIDRRAVQLAQLGLFIKAKKKRRTVGLLAFNVVSSDFFLPDYYTVKDIFEPQTGTAGHRLDKEQKELIQEVWRELQDAHKFGSLIQLSKRLKARLKELEEKQSKAQMDLFVHSEIETHKNFTAVFFENLKKAVEQHAREKGYNLITSKTHEAITFLELITMGYDVAATNPPYTDSSDFGPELKSYIEENYKKPHKFHINLYASFIMRCYEMAGADGKVALVHPPTFMYIKTFENVRKFILEKTSIDLFVEWGYLGMFHQSARVDTAMYILDKKLNTFDSTFIKLNHIYEGKRYEAFVEAYDNLISGVTFSNNYTIPQSKLKIIKSWPFIYWISDEFREKFGAADVSHYYEVVQGLITADTNRFLRFWWEIRHSQDDKAHEKWIQYAKGGPFNKWFGNLWTTVNWGNNGYAIKNFRDSKGKVRSRPQSEHLYFKEGITYTTSGSKGASFRLLPANSIFDVGGSAMFAKEEDLVSLPYAIGFINSTLSKYTLECLNPTVNTTQGDIKRIPFVLPKKDKEKFVSILASANIEIKKYLTKFSFIETGYSISPYTINGSIRHFFNQENLLLTQVLINEAIINEKIFDVYDLTEHDRTMVLAKEGESIGGLPVTFEARDTYLAKAEATKEFPLDDIRDFIKALPTKEFTTEERKAIESGFESLYQSNNNLEEFCIRHQVNPINVWYWFKQSNVIPQQRMHTLAMEFLADMIREILMEDEDGIIPLVPNAGEKVLLDRIEEKFHEKGFSSAQYSSFDTLLGRPIHEYLNKYFFGELSDHLNLFMYLPKTPFIWHLSSGPKQGFDCYIIIYKWSRDKLMQMHNVYIEHRERSLINRRDDLADSKSVDAQNEKDLIFKQLKEIEAFKIKIDELLDEGYNPVLDDGVGKNIAPLQKKKMIPYEVLNEGQLKKYLNADW